MAVKPVWGATLAAVVTVGVLAMMPWSNVSASATRPVAAIAQATPSATPSAEPTCEELRADLDAAEAALRANQDPAQTGTLVDRLVKAAIAFLSARCPVTPSATPSPAAIGGD